MGLLMYVSPYDNALWRLEREELVKGGKQLVCRHS